MVGIDAGIEGSRISGFEDSGIEGGIRGSRIVSGPEVSRGGTEESTLGCLRFLGASLDSSSLVVSGGFVFGFLGLRRDAIYLNFGPYIRMC